jgi:hypothetical protein
MENDSDGVLLTGSEVFCGQDEAWMAGLTYWGEQGCEREAKGLSGIGISLAGANFPQHRILQLGCAPTHADRTFIDCTPSFQCHPSGCFRTGG